MERLLFIEGLEVFFYFYCYLVCCQYLHSIHILNIFCFVFWGIRKIINYSKDVIPMFLSFTNFKFPMRIIYLACTCSHETESRKRRSAFCVFFYAREPNDQWRHNKYLLLSVLPRAATGQIYNPHYIFSPCCVALLLFSCSLYNWILF